MTFEIIEPTPRKISNSERRRQIAHQAHQCAKWLRISGFEVMAVVGGLRQPRIFIKPDPKLCDMLEGVVDAFERTPRHECRFRYVVRFGCMVQWEIGGAA